MTTRPGDRASAATSLNSIGVRWTGAPAISTCRRARSTLRSPISTIGSAGSDALSAWRSATRSAREQLAHRERLGQVVVGAGVERLDLVALLAPRGEGRRSARATTRGFAGSPRSRRGREARGRGSRDRAAAWRPSSSRPGRCRRPAAVPALISAARRNRTISRSSSTISTVRPDRGLRPPTSSRRSRDRARARSHPAGRRAAREREAEDRAAVGSRPDRHRAAVRGDDGAADREPETDTAGSASRFAR